MDLMQQPIETKEELSEEALYQRRKAQNRAAQRAFRERKDTKIRELADKLDAAEQQRQRLERELEQMKQHNAMLDVENQMLLEAQQAQGAANSISNTPPSTLSPSFGVSAPAKTDFIISTLGPQEMSVHGITPEQIQSQASKPGPSYVRDDEKLLTISAVWDYIMEFTNLNEDIHIDISRVMDRLRGNEVCHGFGPAYPLRLINEILMESIGVTGDCGDAADISCGAGI